MSEGRRDPATRSGSARAASRADARGARREGRGAKFDAAIDGAVREMLDVEPPPGLRGRVLDRIEAADPVASAFRRKGLWLGFPIAAAAVIVLAVLAPSRDAVTPAPAAPRLAHDGPRVAVPPPGTADPRPLPPESRRAAAVRVASGGSPAGPARPQRAEERLVGAAVAPADGAIELTALASIAPITAPATVPETITTHDIVITPLASIAPLQTAPLSPPDRRN